MATGKLDIGRQFAILTGQIEDAHAIAVEGQRAGLSNDEAKALVHLMLRQIEHMTATCERIAAA